MEIRDKYGVALFILLIAGLGPAAAGSPSRPPANPYRLAVDAADYRLQAGRPGPAPRPAGRPGQGRPLAALVERHARARGLDPALVHAVIQAESAYRAEAVSRRGAVGLMQVMPGTGRRFGETDLADPESNLRAGTAYLSYLLARFDDLPLALAAYNAGEGAVQRHGNRLPPYPETRSYVRSVLLSYGAAGSLPGSRSRLYLAGTRLERRDLAPYRLRRDPWGSGDGS